MRFGRAKGFRVILGVLRGLDLVWESATPTTHIWEKSPKISRFFVGGWLPYQDGETELWEVNVNIEPGSPWGTWVSLVWVGSGRMPVGRRMNEWLLSISGEMPRRSVKLLNLTIPLNRIARIFSKIASLRKCLENSYYCMEMLFWNTFSTFLPGLSSTCYENCDWVGVSLSLGQMAVVLLQNQRERNTKVKHFKLIFSYRS